MNSIEISVLIRTKTWSHSMKSWTSSTLPFLITFPKIKMTSMNPSLWKLVSNSPKGRLRQRNSTLQMIKKDSLLILQKINSWRILSSQHWENNMMVHQVFPRSLKMIKRLWAQSINIGWTLKIFNSKKKILLKKVLDLISSQTIIDKESKRISILDNPSMNKDN